MNGDQFYRKNWDVLQADFNAARNVLVILYAPEIDCWTSFIEVKVTLIKRIERHRLKLLNQDSSYTIDKVVLMESELPNTYVYI